VPDSLTSLLWGSGSVLTRLGGEAGVKVSLESPCRFHFPLQGRYRLTIHCTWYLSQQDICISLQCTHPIMTSTPPFAGPSPLNKLAASTWARDCLIVFLHHAFVFLQVTLSCMPFQIHGKLTHPFGPARVSPLTRETRGVKEEDRLMHA
jgi:hypothetical protein